jgi:hypothetical protein
MLTMAHAWAARAAALYPGGAAEVAETNPGKAADR